MESAGTEAEQIKELVDMEAPSNQEMAPRAMERAAS